MWRFRLLRDHLIGTLFLLYQCYRLYSLSSTFFHSCNTTLYFLLSVTCETILSAWLDSHSWHFKFMHSSKAEEQENFSAISRGLVSSCEICHNQLFRSFNIAFPQISQRHVACGIFLLYTYSLFSLMKSYN